MCTKCCPRLVVFRICYSWAHLVLRDTGRPSPYSSLPAISTILVAKSPGDLDLKPGSATHWRDLGQEPPHLCGSQFPQLSN